MRCGTVFTSRRKWSRAPREIRETIGEPTERRLRANGREHESDLALRLFPEVGGDFCGSSDKYFFEFFSEFASDTDLGVGGEDLDKSGKRSSEAVGRFEVHRGVVAFGRRGNFVEAASRFLRQKASKVKRKSRESAGN